MSVPVSTTTRPWLRAAIRFCVEQPRFALLGWFIAICMATAGLTVLDFDTTTESVLDRNDPAWSFYQESLRRFGGDQVLVVAVEGERPFDSDVLREVERISRLAADVEGVRRVDSVATFPFVHVTAEVELTLDPAMELLPADPAVAKELRSIGSLEGISFPMMDASSPSMSGCVRTPTIYNSRRLPPLKRLWAKDLPGCQASLFFVWK